jgi:secondary thiamine-phosphate synthase enzyme
MQQRIGSRKDIPQILPSPPFFRSPTKNKILPAMPHYQQFIRVKTQGKSLQKVTTQVTAVVTQSGIQTGLCSLFLRHTSASLIIQENADPDVLLDLANFLTRLVPESDRYIHSTEGADDMPAHIRTVLTHTSEQIPIANGRLVLGTWQGIYLWEHRQHNHERELVVHVMGD